MYYIVKFHADGGQRCIPGLRSFENQDKAYRFAEERKNEKDHVCLDSIKMYASRFDLGPGSLDLGLGSRHMTLSPEQSGRLLSIFPALEEI